MKIFIMRDDKDNSLVAAFTKVEAAIEARAVLVTKILENHPTDDMQTVLGNFSIYETELFTSPIPREIKTFEIPARYL